MKRRSENFPISPEKKKTQHGCFHIMDEIQLSECYKPHFRLVCVCSEEFGYLIHYRSLNILVRQKMVFVEVDKRIRLEQKPWLEP